MRNERSFKLAQKRSDWARVHAAGEASFPRLRRVLRVLRWALLVPWSAFIAWLFIYEMPLSALHAAAGIYAIAPFERNRRKTWVARFIVLSAIVTIPMIGFREYSAKTVEMHCRVQGFFALKAPIFCNRGNVLEGIELAENNQDVLSPRERLGVHGFNVLLAAGGLLIGFREVAEETLLLSFVDAPPKPHDIPGRRARCTSTKIAGLAEVQRSSDFAMRSAIVQSHIRDMRKELAHAQSANRALRWNKGKNNNDVYGNAFLEDSARVALALQVDDSKLSLSKHGNELVAEWTGTISYPPNAMFSFDLPAIFGPHPLMVSEALFCGMLVDGAMNPYRLRYRWTLDAAL